MKAHEFVKAVVATTIRDGLREYHTNLTTRSPSQAKDPLWRSVLTLRETVDEPTSAMILDAMKIATIDTVAALLGILDGEVTLPRTTELFELKSLSDNYVLKGTLTDLFLAAVEAEEPDMPSTM